MNNLELQRREDYLLDSKKPNTVEVSRISVIIACKNEENNIKRLINSLKNQSYRKDLYEVIFADDASTDATADMIKQNIQGIDNFHYLCVKQDAFPELKGKKKAISYAVEFAISTDRDIGLPLQHRGDQMLAFTDADCAPEKDWLSDINVAFAGGYDFYAGYSPVFFIDTISAASPTKNNLFSKLKNIERASIFAVSAGGFGLGIPLTCTARNMAYKASLWQRSEGFSGIGNILSGDDDLMLHKSRKFINKYYFSFNPEAVVNSFNDYKLNKYINQETRRASKLIYYPHYIQLMIIFITIFYLLLLYHVVTSIINLSFAHDLSVSIFLKVLFEFILLAIFLKKINNFGIMKSFLLAEILYVPYFLFFGLKGTLGRYKWKS